MKRTVLLTLTAVILAPFAHLSAESSAEGALKRISANLLDGKTREKLAEAFKNRDEAAAELIRFAFDDKKYPVPAKAQTGWQPGKDYQKGQILIEGRTEAALARHNLLETALLAALGRAVRMRNPGGLNVGRKYLKGTLKDQGKPVPVTKYNLTDTAPAWKAVAASLVASYKNQGGAKMLQEAREAAKAASRAQGGRQQANRVPQLGVAAAALFSGDYKAAAALRSPKETLEDKIFTELVRRHVMILNESAAGKGWNKPELKSMRTLNLYRIALNVCPLRANQRIRAAAREHSEWQARNNTMTHVRPEGKFRTHGERCKRQGYNAPGAENIASGKGEQPIWLWRADAGHHRNLINPKWRAVGFGSAGKYTTFVTGRTLENKALRHVVK